MSADAWGKFIILVMLMGTIVLFLPAPVETKIVFWGILAVLAAYVGAKAEIEY